MLQDNTLSEILTELQRRNPEQIVRIEIGTQHRLTSVPKCRQEENDRATAKSVRDAGIRLGFFKCKACNEIRREVVICGCGIVDDHTCGSVPKSIRGQKLDSFGHVLPDSMEVL